MSQFRLNSVDTQWQVNMKYTTKALKKELSWMQKYVESFFIRFSLYMFFFFIKNLVMSNEPLNVKTEKVLALIKKT